MGQIDERKDKGEKEKKGEKSYQKLPCLPLPDSFRLGKRKHGLLDIKERREEREKKGPLRSKAARIYHAFLLNWKLPKGRKKKRKGRGKRGRA